MEDKIKPLWGGSFSEDSRLPVGFLICDHCYAVVIGHLPAQDAHSKRHFFELEH